MTGAIEAPWSREPTLAGQVKARLELGPIARAVGATIAVQGTVAADVSLGGLLASPFVAGSFHAPQIEVAGVLSRDVSGTLRLDDKAFTVADVAGVVMGERLRGRSHSRRAVRPMRWCGFTWRIADASSARPVVGRDAWRARPAGLRRRSAGRSRETDVADRAVPSRRIGGRAAGIARASRRRSPGRPGG